ncbi:hypothetical protein BBJ28_00011160 [Nothophytophthora sp. Chile5]|nr:hypothetical protein BBJ28_00011160 [Nothophytophthora sp. Chile5]
MIVNPAGSLAAGSNESDATVGSAGASGSNDADVGDSGSYSGSYSATVGSEDYSIEGDSTSTDSSGESGSSESGSSASGSLEAGVSSGVSVRSLALSTSAVIAMASASLGLIPAFARQRSHLQSQSKRHLPIMKFLTSILVAAVLAAQCVHTTDAITFANAEETANTTTTDTTGTMVDGSSTTTDVVDGMGGMDGTDMGSMESSGSGDSGVEVGDSASGSTSGSFEAGSAGVSAGISTQSAALWSTAAVAVASTLALF